MKALKYILAMILVLALALPALAFPALAGRGPGGPGGALPTATPVPNPTATPVPSGGGSGDIPDTGTLYGDLYVILRDEWGVPILSAYGCIQPISTMNGTTTILTIDGEITISVWEGEPFALPTYTDAAGDLVECELTEDMATWVEGVDFGRLNLGRAPEGVIAHAFDEAVKKMNVASTMKLDPAGRLVLTLIDEVTGLPVDKTIDAPAENLALYIEMMKYGDWILENTDPIVQGGPPEGQGPPEGDGPSSESRPVLNANAIALLNGLGFTSLGVSDSIPILNNAEIILAASLLAAAADKTGSITLDKVVYINSVYGINQVGGLPGEVEGKTYYDFSTFTYGRASVYGSRGSPDCQLPGWVYVLQPEADTDNNPATLHFVTTCMDLLGYEEEHDPTINAVRFTDMVEGYTTIPLTYSFDFNVRAFTQASDDALQVIEYIHNYKIPEVLYP